MYINAQVTKSLVCAGSREVGSDLHAIFKVSRLLSFSSPAAASPPAAPDSVLLPPEAGALEPPHPVAVTAIAAARHTASKLFRLFFILHFSSLFSSHASFVFVFLFKSAKLAV